ncbi:MAG: hypothetical protein KatS3mg002_0337 [Candidatus Woesearchaeota archaeon]|nr:MAG: hypothetical protein KatS3mg002_0337 [Candidatus Woesearchaeota archaeon]
MKIEYKRNKILSNEYIPSIIERLYLIIKENDKFQSGINNLKDLDKEISLYKEKIKVRKNKIKITVDKIKEITDLIESLKRENEDLRNSLISSLE